MPELDADFHDERISMLYWYPQIKDLDVPTIETEFFDLSGTESSFELYEGGVDKSQVLETLKNIPVEEIQNCIEKLPTDEAHIRSDWKSSQLGDGTKVTKNPQRIQEQVMHLIDSMVMSQFPIRALAVREWVDLKTFGDSYMGVIAPEVRFIVDEGDVLGGFVDVYSDDFDNSYTDEETQEILQEIEGQFEKDYDQLEQWASRVAKELDDSSWSVDFIQDSSGNWHLTDMALYGLYWNDREGEWMNISNIPSGKPYNLEENIPDELQNSKNP